MKIIIVNEALNKHEVIGDTKTDPIPRIGERIIIWYKPSPTVMGIAYDYEGGQVYVYT